MSGIPKPTSKQDFTCRAPVQRSQRIAGYITSLPTPKLTKTAPISSILEPLKMTHLDPALPISAQQGKAIPLASLFEKLLAVVLDREHKRLHLQKLQRRSSGTTCHPIQPQISLPRSSTHRQSLSLCRLISGIAGCPGPFMLQ